MEKIYFIKNSMADRTANLINLYKDNFSNLFGLECILTDYDENIERNKILYLPKNNEDIRAEDTRSGNYYVYRIFFDNLFKYVLSRNDFKSNEFLLKNKRRGIYNADGEYNNPNIEFTYIQNVVMLDIKLYKEMLKIVFVPTDLNSNDFLMLEIDINKDSEITNCLMIADDYEEKNIQLNHKQLDHVIMLAYFSGNDELGTLDRSLIKAIVEENYELLESYYAVKMMEFI